MNRVDGFFAGVKAFNLIAAQIGDDDKPSLKEIVYNGFSIKLDEFIGENEVVGIGEPYASIAKEMKKRFEDDD